MDSRLSRKLVPLGGGLSEEVRYFSDKAIQDQIDKALSRVDPGKKGVVLKINLDSEGASAVMAAKLREHWSIGVIADRAWSGDWAVGAETVFEW